MGETPSNQLITKMNHEDQSLTNLYRPNDEKCLTRRKMLKTFVAGAVSATIGAVFPRTFGLAVSRSATSESPIAEGWAKQAVPPRTAAFNLADVRLLDGMFRRAQKRDAQYLLQ